MSKPIKLIKIDKTKLDELPLNDGKEYVSTDENGRPVAYSISGAFAEAIMEWRQKNVIDTKMTQVIVNPKTNRTVFEYYAETNPNSRVRRITGPTSDLKNNYEKIYDTLFGLEMRQFIGEDPSSIRQEFIEFCRKSDEIELIGDEEMEVLI